MTTAPTPNPPPPITPLTPITEPESRDLIHPDSVLSHFIWVNPARMSGEPCFKGTRVPVKTLFDYLAGGDSLADFLEGFPNVTREQAVAVIDLAQLGLLGGLRRL